MAWPVDQAVAYIKEDSGKHFDPKVVAHFELRLADILGIREANADPQAT